MNRIDVVRHDAPALADFGDYDIGVRTLQFVNPDQVDVVSTELSTSVVRYDRKLTVEIWYPAIRSDGDETGSDYQTTTRNLGVTASLRGRALRDAPARALTQAAPLIIISHGYPGNRYLMSHLGENLASKGYVVASIDHPDSTYEDQGSIWSTLYHRPRDQLFVIDKIVDNSNTKSSFLNQTIDSDTVGIVGYSMGGYGLLVNLGAGYTDATANFAENLPDQVVRQHAANNPDFAEHGDERIKAGIAIAPCCMNRGMWDSSGLSAVSKPLFLMAGDADDTAGYETGVRAIFDAAINSDRYLLTFLNAGHNAIAPIPLPVEIHESPDRAGAFHYTDAVWDSTRSSNVMFHFATAFFDYHLKGDESRLSYLELLPNAQDGVYAIEDGTRKAEHSYWEGFPQYTARGLRLWHLAPSE